jgi:hypothetical protein
LHRAEFILKASSLGGEKMIEEVQVAEILNTRNIIKDPAKLTEYSRDMSFTSAIKPDFIVKPGNSAEIEKIVKLANKTQTPLVPMSSGPPHFKGDTVPSTGGAVVVDLSEMKRIIRVDRTNRVVMFEPGVTFGELIPAVTKEGLRLNMPLLPRKTKSVVGSLLEREPVVMPKYHWDIADPLNCVEIIFGSGDLFRTGAAAGPGTIQEQWAAKGGQVEAAGPSTASWYRIIQGSQGSMGIVTWASARCELLPKLEKPFLIGSPDLGKIMEMAYWLIRLRIPNECFILNSTNLAAIAAKNYPANYQYIKNSLPEWILFYNLAGYDYFPEDKVDGQIQDSQEIAQRSCLTPVQALGGIPASQLLEMVQKPSDDPFWKLRVKGACQDIFFISNYDSVPGLVDFMYEDATNVKYPISDMGVYIQPIVQGCNFHCEFNLFYGLNNPHETEKIRNLTNNSLEGLMSRGAFFSRPYGEMAGVVMNKDAATVEALKKVKFILDPQHIMNPGKLCF